MLNKSIPLLREKNKTLETMKYGDKQGAEIMRDILFRTDFWGMSVSFVIAICLPYAMRVIVIPLESGFSSLGSWVPSLTGVIVLYSVRAIDNIVYTISYDMIGLDKTKTN